MSADSKIEWTDATWNVVIGCDKVSPGCDHCYAIRTAHRMQANPNPKIAAAYAGTEADGEWTGKVNLIHDRLDLPLRWTKPKKIFVNAQSDLFHADVPDDFIARVWAVMALAPQHTFQILTKRPARMRALLNSERFDELFAEALYTTEHPRGEEQAEPIGSAPGPLPNVWLGVSVEDQKRADLRVPALLMTPAAVRFLSMEPLLGPVDLTRIAYTDGGGTHLDVANGRHGIPDLWQAPAQHIDWVIVGGESGPGARPMHPTWVDRLRDQCVAAGVAFHFKQWGSHDEHGTPTHKKAAGRELDGRTWDEFPESVTA
jgi:protein gp37